MASLKDHDSGLPNCYPSSTFTLSTMTLCHTSLGSLNSSSIRNSISLLCYKASLTWVNSSRERHHRATEFYLFPFLQWLLFHSCHSVEWTSYLFRTWKFRFTMQNTLQSRQPAFLLEWMHGGTPPSSPIQILESVQCLCKLPSSFYALKAGSNQWSRKKGKIDLLSHWLYISRKRTEHSKAIAEVDQSYMLWHSQMYPPRDEFSVTSPNH